MAPRKANRRMARPDAEFDDVGTAKANLHGLGGDRQRKLRDRALPRTQPIMTELTPSFNPPNQWRTREQKEFLDSAAWKRIRAEVLHRDDYTCRYCGFRGNFYMIVDHADGNPENHREDNLHTTCSWCSAIKHAGLSVAVRGEVELYSKAQRSQVEILNETRRLRGLGHTDDDIRAALGLTQPVDFVKDHAYLTTTVGFVVKGRGSRSLGLLTVSNVLGQFLRDDERRSRARLPPPRKRESGAQQ